MEDKCLNLMLSQDNFLVGFEYARDSFSELQLRELLAEYVIRSYKSLKSIYDNNEFSFSNLTIIITEDGMFNIIDINFSNPTLNKTYVLNSLMRSRFHSNKKPFDYIEGEYWFAFLASAYENFEDELRRLIIANLNLSITSPYRFIHDD